MQYYLTKYFYCIHKISMYMVTFNSKQVVFCCNCMTDYIIVCGRKDTVTLPTIMRRGFCILVLFIPAIFHTLLPPCHPYITIHFMEMIFSTCTMSVANV